ncbi:MAG: 50S ribosomal protein L9 [Planctomycetes bacterium]|nr:50S ribosomal protein L9 [Planctomycetota bacterium]
MEVLLSESIDKLGTRGDVVHVKDGYARNFLLPRGLALPVSEANKKRLDLEHKRYVQREIERKIHAEELANKLASISVTISAQATPEGHLYGAITPKQIHDAFKAEGIELDIRTIIIKEPIKELGSFEIPIKLHREVKGTLRLWIAPDETGSKR